MNHQLKVLVFLLLAIFGILVLFIISQITVQQATITEIKELHLNSKIRFSAQVITSKFFEDSNFQIIALKDKTGIINATLFTKKQILFNETKIYLIKGEITEYKTARQVKILTISIQ